ncbi:hypothetical protein AC579_640 [Pseudocercospora musae]|uniref:Methylated-DNA-[protein]-cysteine S-methyltransferase DNA binding domain-containing protein n=1 Tax=Pseudocercospora musae TaxID=113226 RepID=A0A139I8T2_9PEZI|nr:hypothetical protein AC579_640 [Pseudocercospora musae]
MPRERSDEAEAWYVAVYQAVQEVPYGHVTSYGHIATLLGYPILNEDEHSERPRQDRMEAGQSDNLTCAIVGMCLKYLPRATDQPDARYNSDTVPWQRVINSKGIISQRQVWPAAAASHNLCLLTSDAFRGTNGAARQEAQLNVEGVEVGRGPLGERTVDFSTYGWFPNTLPSEES